MCKRVKREMNDQVAYCRTIAKWMYDNMKKDASTCYPHWRIEKQFQGLSMLAARDLLKQEFDIQWVQAGMEMYYYLPYPYKVETKLAHYFKNKIALDIQAKEQGLFEKYEPVFRDDTPPDPEQRQAVTMGLNSCLTLITGGPGRGKSKVIKWIVENMNLRDARGICASYTGKATHNLADILGLENLTTAPMTLHRLLYKGISKEDDSLEDAVKATDFDYFIVDEASTFSKHLAYKIFEKYESTFNKKNIKIILVGDVHQLPPLSWGAIFEELYYLPGINKIELKTVHRVIKDSRAQSIITNAERIINRQYLPKNNRPPMKWDTNECFQMISGGMDKLKDILIQFRNAGMDPSDYQPASECQVICPYNLPLANINSFTQRLYDQEYQDTLVYDSAGRMFREKDYVMMTVNNYDIEVMNGTTGVVVATNDTEITVDFTSRRSKRQNEILKDNKHTFTLEYNLNKKRDDADNLEVLGNKTNNAPLSSKNSVEDLELAYSISGHKSQGSEYYRTIIYLPHLKSNKFFLNYRLLYTILTRAQFAVIIIAEDLFDLDLAVDKIPPRRYNYFADQIRDLLQVEGIYLSIYQTAPIINPNNLIEPEIVQHVEALDFNTLTLDAGEEEEYYPGDF